MLRNSYTKGLAQHNTSMDKKKGVRGKEEITTTMVGENVRVGSNSNGRVCVCVC